MKSHPLMLGIVGNSATGKTTLTRGVIRILGTNGVTPICLDDYHCYDRTERLTRGLTALDPASNNVELMTQHLRTLRAGGGIRKPRYNHSSGALQGSELVVATDLIVVYGLLTLATPELRELFDVTVYLDPHPDLLHAWKLRRDVGQRGYTAEQVEAQLRRRAYDTKHHILPQRRYADLVIRFFPNHASTAPDDDRGTTQHNVCIVQRPTAPRLDLDDLLHYAAQHEQPRLRQRRDIIDQDGCPADVLEIDSNITPMEAAAFEELLWGHMDHLRHLKPSELGNFAVGHTAGHSDTLALVQLLITYQLVQTRRRRA